MNLLELFTKKEGIFTLEDRSFVGGIFYDMILYPVPGQRLIVRNVKFIKCKVQPGTCLMSSGVELDDVVFEELQCGDAIRLLADNVIGKVTIRGKKPGRLWVTPAKQDGKKGQPKISGTLDISGYKGEVIIIGLPIHQVCFNPDNHYTIDLDKFRSVKWKALGMEDSYWRIAVKKVKAFGARTGVFRLPKQERSWYEGAMKDREALRKLGAL